MGFKGKTVIEVKGRWALEQLGPIDLCMFEADVATALGDTLRQGFRLVLAFLGEESESGEGTFQKLERMMQTLDADPKALLGSIMDRDILQDAERISETLVDMLRSVSTRELRSLAERMFITREGAKGGLRVAVVAGQPPSIPVATVEDLDALLSDSPHEFWKLLLWGFQVNLRPLIAELSTRLRSGSSELGQTQASVPPQP